MRRVLVLAEADDQVVDPAEALPLAVAKRSADHEREVKHLRDLRLGDGHAPQCGVDSIAALPTRGSIRGR